MNDFEIMYSNAEYEEARIEAEYEMECWKELKKELEQLEAMQ